jgi:hypothetical protein
MAPNAPLVFAEGQAPGSPNAPRKGNVVGPLPPAAAGSNLDHAVRVTVYLTDLQHFALVNRVMAEYFSQPYPARAAIGVAALPKGAAVEIDAILEL